MISRGELKGQVLRLLNKTPQNQGFYTDDKINDAIQETMDYIATEMMLADEGWQTKLTYLDIIDGQLSLDVPAHIALIKELRYKVGSEFVPMTYDDGSKQVDPDPTSTGLGYAIRYRILDNAFYFTPAIAGGGTGYLQIEHMSFPKVLQDDEDFIEQHFHAAFRHYMKYRVASVLGSSFGNSVPPWGKQEAEWKERVRDLIPKRNLQTTYIRDFYP